MYDIDVSHVLRFFDNDLREARLWFFKKNPMLGDMRPIDMIILGRGAKLEKFIKQQEEEYIAWKEYMKGRHVVFDSKS